MGENRDIRKTIRFSEDEFSEIEHKLKEHNLTISELARASVLNKKIHTNLRRDLIYHLSRIENNLNQIAKNLNTKKDEIPNSEVIKILIDFQKELEDLKNDS